MAGLSLTAVRWLENRGLDPEMVAGLGVESRAPISEKSGNPLPGEWLAIPYWRRNPSTGDIRRAACKYRRLDEKQHCQDKQPERCFWNETNLLDPDRQHLPVIITEGEWDAMAAIQAVGSSYRVVSVPDGANDRMIPLDEEGTKYDFMASQEVIQAIRSAPQIILAVDGDSPGQCLLHDLNVRIDRRGKTFRPDWHRLQGKAKDYGDVLRLWGADNLGRFVRERSIPVLAPDRLLSMSELPEVPALRTFRTGMDFLDPHFTIAPGQMTVLTGPPGSGKTTFLNDLLSRTVTQNEWVVAVASFEQQPQRYMRRNLLWHRLGYDPNEVYDQTGAKAWLDRHFRFVLKDPMKVYDVGWALSMMEIAKRNHMASVFVLDPWNEMEHCPRQGESLTSYVGRSIRDLRGCAEALDMHLIVVAHPTKLPIDAQGRVRRPTLYDISDSAHWYNKPDCGLVIERNKDKGWTDVHVDKVRFEEIVGRPGRVRLVFNPSTRRYSLAPEDMQSED